jgi:hypothetical protein
MKRFLSLEPVDIVVFREIVKNPYPEKQRVDRAIAG